MTLKKQRLSNKENNICTCCVNIMECCGNIFINISTFFFLLLLPHAICSSNFNAGCKISEKLWGRYIQSSLGALTINESHVTTKGVCTNQTKDLFVFFNRDENCFYCLIMMKRHRNIIQYRETDCVHTSSHSICSHMQLEAPMHTLVRENSTVMRCPMNGQYAFSINDPMKEPCTRVDSVAKPCVGRTRYQLLFNDCNNAFNNNAQTDDLYMECIGQWKEGSDNYLYVRMVGPQLHKMDDSHRCLRYHINDLEMRATMTADATCQGLRSSHDGPYILKFIRKNTSIPDRSCQFPDWLDDITWFDHEKNLRVRLDKEAGILTESKKFESQQISPSSSSSSLWTPYEQSVDLRCLNTEDTEDEDRNEFYAIIANNYRCDLKIQCLKLWRHSETVLALSRGDLDRVTDDPSVCLRFHYTSRHILLADSVFTTSHECPSPGIYHVNFSPTCPGKVLIGCQKNTHVVVERSCSNHKETYECASSWNDNRGRVVIVTRKSRFASLHCFSVNTSANILHFDGDCSRHNTRQHSYAIPPYEPCRNHPPYVVFTTRSPSFHQDLEDEDDDTLSSGMSDSQNEKREKHIYLVDENSDVTVDGVWEVKHGKGGWAGVAGPRADSHPVITSLVTNILQLILVNCLLRLL